MKKFIILIALLVLLPSPVFAGWQWVTPWPTAEGLIDWCALSPDVHIVLGRNGYILRTLDGGFTWTGTYGGEVARGLSAIFFVSPREESGVRA